MVIYCGDSDLTARILVVEIVLRKAFGSWVSVSDDLVQGTLSGICFPPDQKVQKLKSRLISFSFPFHSLHEYIIDIMILQVLINFLFES